MSNQIVFTKDEVIDLIKAFSNIEGFLLSVKDSSYAIDILEYPINMLTEKVLK